MSNVTTAAYDEFVQDLEIGQNVSVYNMETGAIHSTQIIGLNTKHIVTKRLGSTDDPVRFTRRGTGTKATGTPGMKVRPYVSPRMVKFNPRSVYRPVKKKLETVAAVEAAA